MSLLSNPLQAFMAVAKDKTVHGAAKNLGLTQTGVTQRIRTLEASIGATLFIRSRRGMLLTSEGEALLRFCTAARDLEGETLAILQQAGKSSTARITITGPTSITRSRIIPASFPILRRYPQLYLSFEITDRSTWLENLRTGDAQLAILPRELVTKELDSKLLKPERYVLLGPKSWKNRSIVDIVKKEKIIDFDSLDSTTHQYLKKFKLLEYANSERHYVNNNESLSQMVEAELGYGVFTIDFAERFLRRCNVVVLNDEKVLEQEVALAWYPRHTSAEYWRELIGAIK